MLPSQVNSVGKIMHRVLENWKQVKPSMLKAMSDKEKKQLLESKSKQMLEEMEMGMQQMIKNGYSQELAGLTAMEITMDSHLFKDD